LVHIQASHNESGERLVTIMGTEEAKQSALHLLYETLEAEKHRQQQMRQTQDSEISQVTSRAEKLELSG
jgi:hypothetical protein